MIYNPATKRIIKATKKSVDSKSVPQLIKILTTHFNKYIRLRDGKVGYFVCISCQQIKGLEQIQAGHYLSAGHNAAVRFDENNCHCQCIKCNMYLSGNVAEYRKNLITKIGLPAVERLELKAAMRGFKWDRFSLLIMIDEYKKKVKAIKSNK